MLAARHDPDDNDILIVYIRVSNSFFYFLQKQVDVVHVYKVINLFLQFSKFAHFLSMELSGIIVITYSNVKNASP